MNNTSGMLIVMLLVPAVLLSGCQSEAPPREEPVRTVRAMRVADFDGLVGRSFPGRAAATQEVDLAFRVSGPLIALAVQVGDQVEKDDLIARIDPRDFEVALRNSEGSWQRSQANERRAQSDFERSVSIQQEDPGAISQASVDQAKEARDVAQADVAALQASVDAARDALGDTQLQAPFSGTIVATYVENFEFVREQQMVVRLLDKSRIEFQINIPETMISLTPYVQDLEVRFDAFPGVDAVAEIKEVGTEASVTTRTFPVTLIMDQPEGATILPGMAGRATGVVRPPEDEEGVNIVIPVKAIFAPGAARESSVWLIDETTNTVSRRGVQIGELSSVGYSITAGLEPGDVIATAGVHFLKEGQQVRPEIQ